MTPDEIIAFFTIVLAIATIALVYVTWVLAKEAKQTREIQTRPEIAVTFEMTTQGDAIMFVIENVGLGSAYDISVKSDTVLRSGSVDLTQAKFMNLKVLKPKEKLRTLFTIVQNQGNPLGDNANLVFSDMPEFVITFKNKSGEAFAYNQFFDMRRFDSFRPEPKRY